MSAESMSVACRNCTFSGTANITHGTLTASGTPNNTKGGSSKQEIEASCENGFIGLEVNSVGAYVELATTTDLNQTVEYTGHMTLNGEPLLI